MLIPLHIIDHQLFTIFEKHSLSYATKKLFQFDKQAYTNHLNLRF